MELQNPKFKTIFNKNYSKIKKPQNLSCLCLEESKNYYILSPLKNFTYINKLLLINKQKRTISSLKSKKFPKELKIKEKHYFSLFLGLYKKNNKKYMIFVDKVELVQFPKKGVNIFEIKNLVVISMSKFNVNEELSYCFNLIFNKGFYFSYDFDISNNYCEKNIKEFRKKENNNLNWIFCANRGLQKIFLNGKLNEWVIPVIFGSICYNKYNFGNNLNMKFYFIQKTSILDILEKKSGDPLVRDITVSNSFYVLDLIVEFEQNYFLLSYCLGNFDLKKKQKQQENDLKSIKRYFYFLQKHISSENFFYCSNKTDISVFKDIGYDIKVFSDRNDEILFNFFEDNIKQYVEPNCQNINTITFTSENLQDFYYDTIPFLCSLFILSCQQKILKISKTIFSEKNLFLREIEFDIINLSKKQKTNKQSIISIYNYFTQTSKTNNKGIFKFFSKIVSIAKNSKNEFQKDLLMLETRNILNKVFGDIEEEICDMINFYRKKEKSIFSPFDLKMTFITHNCCGYKPFINKDEDKFFYQKLKSVKNCDILIFGFQEIMEMKSKNLKKIITEDNLKVKNRWRNFIAELFRGQFDVFFTKNLLGLFVMVLVKPFILERFDIKIKESNFLRLGAFKFANKASIYIQLSINYQIIRIANCHLASGTKDKNCKKRIENLQNVLELLKNGKKPILTFIMGDLNFRNKENFQIIQKLIIKHKNTEKEDEKEKIIEEILKTEELSNILKNNFPNLSEEKINFLPSYKYSVGTNKYNYSEGKRVPSHTDRILFEINEDVLNINEYFVEDNTHFSDHKPVVLNSTIKILEFATEKFQALFDDQILSIN